MPKTNPIPVQVPDWQLQPLANGRASLIVVPVDFGGVFNVKSADIKSVKYDAGKWAFKTEDLTIEGSAKYQPDGLLGAGSLSLRIVSVSCLQYGQITGEDEATMGWDKPEDMPPICGDDDWVWALLLMVF